jgi:hypothetical protein
MHPFFYYIIFSYPIIAGVLWEADSKDLPIKVFVWLFSPLFLPVFVGMFLSKYFNK